MKKHQTLKPVASQRRKTKTIVKSDVSTKASTEHSSLKKNSQSFDYKDVKTLSLTAKKREKLLADKLDEENE
jgi:hypothetical protein